jgi:hypothetical protein
VVGEHFELAVVQFERRREGALEPRAAVVYARRRLRPAGRRVRFWVGI